MKVVFEDAGPCQHIIRFNMDSTMVAPEYDTVLSEYQKYTEIPGFRTGKAPMNIVEKYFNSKIVEDVRDKLLRKYLVETVSTKKIKLLNVIDVSKASISDKKELSFSVTIEVIPEFSLPKYKKLPLKKRKIVINDTDVDNMVQQITARLTTKYKAVDDHPANQNNLVLIDYDGRCEDKPLEQIASGCPELLGCHDIILALNDTKFLHGFVDGLIGVRAGETKEIVVNFPEDYHVKTVAGEKVVYTVKVKSVMETEKLPLCEEHLKQLGVKSIDELKQRVRSEMMAKMEADERQRLKSEINKLLLEDATFDVPPSLLEDEKERLIKNIAMELSKEGNSADVIKSKIQEMYAFIQKTAIANVRLLFILLKIAEEEKINVTEDELKAHIEKLSVEYRVKTEWFDSFIKENDMMSDIKTDLLVKKTLDYILESAKIREE